MLLGFSCAGQKVRAPALPEGQKDVELPGMHFLRVSDFLRARPEALAGRAVSLALPRPLLGDRHQCRASASPRHPARVQPLPQRRCRDGCDVVSPLQPRQRGGWPGLPAPSPAPPGAASTRSPSFPIPSLLPFLHVFLIFLPSVLLGSLPGYFQQWLSLPAREGMDD